jgi:peptide/nickel transport system substrate-binding protein
VPEVGAAPLRRHAGFGVPAAQGAAGRPAFGAEGKTRGQDGELRLLQWQAPTSLSPHIATGTKDFLAASLVLEPLMNFLPDNSLIPTLVKEVPTVENGLLTEDLTSVTYNLLEGVTWSDGEPFTAQDVVFTWQWVTNPENGSTAQEVYGLIETMEAVDDLTVRVTFAEPNPVWFAAHAGSTYGYVYPEHILAPGTAAHDAFLAKPTGTGPYVVDSFTPGDQVTYLPNERYREPDRPYFARVSLKGGGDAASAARAVLQTGEYDHAWNLQVEPQVLGELEQGGAGRLVVARGNSVERLHFNFSDPNTEVDGQRSHKDTPHPIFSDPAVRRAINLAVPRDVISEQFYEGEDEPAIANILVNTPILGRYPTDSPNTSWAFDPEQAVQILEEAGWVMDGDVRAKDGVELRFTYSTTINSVRQKTQAVVKQSLEEIGFRVQLQQVDSAVFFSGNNEQDTSHFYTDVMMYTNNPVSPFPASYFESWYAGPNGENIAQRENQWAMSNNQRYSNPEYDRILEEVRGETDFERAAELFIRLNDILIEDVVILPLVNRAADKYATATSLIHGDDADGNPQDNVAVSPFETNYWNIKNWNRSS